MSGYASENDDIMSGDEVVGELLSVWGRDSPPRSSGPSSPARGGAAAAYVSTLRERVGNRRPANTEDGVWDGFLEGLVEYAVKMDECGDISLAQGMETFMSRTSAAGGHGVKKDFVSAVGMPEGWKSLYNKYSRETKKRKLADKSVTSYTEAGAQYYIGVNDEGTFKMLMRSLMAT